MTLFYQMYFRLSQMHIIPRRSMEYYNAISHYIVIRYLVTDILFSIGTSSVFTWKEEESKASHRKSLHHFQIRSDDTGLF